MKYKKSMIMLVLLIFIFGVASVSASDVNDTVIAGADDSAVELPQADGDEIISTDENELIGQTDNELISEGDSGNFTELKANIAQATEGSTLILNKNYECEDGFDTAGILIDKSITIDGNGSKIDAQGKSRIFKITAENVILKNIIFTNGNTTEDGGAVYFENSGTVSNCNFTDNIANRYGGAVFLFGESTVTNCNFIGNNATSDGGAIRFQGEGTVTNCNFTDNEARCGGAVYFYSTGNVENCNFIGNNATSDGGAVFFLVGNVENCNFTANSASGVGGAIWMDSGTVTNCNFINNKATGTDSKGGAVFFNREGTVTNCNFTGNTGDYGGAVYFYKTGTVTNCNFTDNSAYRGGAVYFDSTGNVSNCNFTGNTATGDKARGGALYFRSSGEIINCNFTGNTASGDGGAVYFSITGSVSNCNFINNKATGTNSWGGAVFFGNAGNVTNCNFINNKATGTDSRGGAVYFNREGNVTNCNFADNSASRGGAIFSVNWYTTADTCIFKRNSGDNVNTVIYPPTLNVNNFTTVYGSGDKLTFDLKTNSSIPVTNGNISISVYFKDNGEWVRNYTCLSGEGWIPDLPVGSYIAVFDTEYAEFQKINRTVTITMPNVRYSINVTSLTTNNRTVNITAKTDIPKDIIWEGKLLFMVPTGENITANYEGNGTWWAVYEFADYGDYQVNATYVGLDNVTVNNGTISCKISTEIIINTASLDLFVGDEIVIVANLTPADAGNVTFTSSNESVVEVDVQGNVIAQGKGQAIITVSFAGNNKYAAAENRTINVTVSLNDASVTVDNNTLDLKAGETYAINATKHPDTIMLDITYTSSNSSVATVNEKGIVTAVGVGTAVITVEVGDDEIYAKNSTNVTVTVSKVPTEIGAKPVTATYNVNRNLVITLKDANGNPVTGVSLSVDLNGAKKYTTDKNGQVKVSTKGLDPKTYTAKITFNGNAKYAKSSKNVKVTVKKAKPKIIAKKKKTYRAKAKTKKLKITLKDNTGKPIKNAKVRLMLKKIGKGSKKKTKSKANKKIAKTNKKGKATFKVKKNKKAKYLAYVKFYANKYYMKTVKKIKITIK